MANVENESSDFDKLKVSGEEAANGLEEQAENLEEQAENLEEQETKSPDKPTFYLEIAGAIGLALIVLVLAWFDVLYFSTAIYLIGVAFIPYGIWMGRKTNTVYTIFLGCVLAAVLTAIYCLWMEIGRYKFDVKAQEARQRVGYRE